MKSISYRRTVRHDPSDLPLFRWAATREVAPFTRGGKWVHSRTGLPATIANTIAELNGLGTAREWNTGCTGENARLVPRRRISVHNDAGAAV
jgi:hypothetical protein